MPHSLGNRKLHQIRTHEKGDTVGFPFLFQFSAIPSTDQIALQKECLWDHVHFNWGLNKVYYKNNQIPLRQHVTIPLSDKLKVRNISGGEHQVMFKVKQGETWYNMPPKHSTNAHDKGTWHVVLQFPGIPTTEAGLTSFPVIHKVDIVGI